MKPQSTIKDKNLEKLRKLNHDILNRNYFDAKIENIYINEFEEQFSKILILNEDEFTAKLTNRMKLIIEDIYSSFALNNDIVAKLLKSLAKMIHDSYYLPNKKLLNKGLSNVSSNPIAVTNFRKHCKNTSNEAIHYSSCKGKMLGIINEKNNITHLVCLTCKASFLSCSVLLFCDSCNCDYYTSISNNKEYLDYLPVTWQNYHCSDTMNEQMRCFSCKELFFIRVKDYLLYCKKCKYECDPITIDWTCLVCQEKFKSPVKIFNPMEFKIIKLAVKDALLNKEFA